MTAPATTRNLDTLKRLDSSEAALATVNRNVRTLKGETESIQDVVDIVGQRGDHLLVRRCRWNQWGTVLSLTLQDKDGHDRGIIEIDWLSQDRKEYRWRRARYTVEGQPPMTIIPTWEQDGHLFFITGYRVA